MNLFLDTEFTTLSKNPKLISIGFVNEDLSRTFYAELTDTYRLDQCDPFVIDEVIPLLDADMPNSIRVNDVDNVYIRAKLTEVKKKLLEWLAIFRQSIIIMVDAPHHDIPLLRKLLGKDWPEYIATIPTNVIPEGYDDIERYESLVQHAYDRNNLNKHHALDDAFAMRYGWMGMQEMLQRG